MSTDRAVEAAHFAIHEAKHTLCVGATCRRLPVAEIAVAAARPVVEREARERVRAAITSGVAWLREHQQNHDDVVRIVGYTEAGDRALQACVSDEAP